MNPADPKILIKGVRKQDRRLLSKTITLIESARSDHQKLARHIVDELLPHTGKAIRLGITGVPGVGKSTFIESLGISLVEAGHRVAVLAVDPSSSRSGGSVMAGWESDRRAPGRPGAPHRRRARPGKTPASSCPGVRSVP